MENSRISTVERNELLNYLSKVQELEILNKHYLDKLSEFYSKQRGLAIPTNIPKPRATTQKGVCRLATSSGLKACFIAFIIHSFPILIILMMSLGRSQTNEILPLIVVSVTVAVVAGIFFGVIFFISSYKKHSKEAKLYHQQVQAVNKRVERETIQKKELEKQIEEINNQRNKTQDILNNLYSTNIIPLHCRDLNGVTYLYNYLSTSNESLQSALTNYNLENLRSQMEQVKTNQREIISQQITNSINQMSIDSQLSSLRAEMEETKRYAKDTAESTEMVATYQYLEYLQND